MILKKTVFILFMMSLLNVASADVWKFLGGNGLHIKHISIDPFDPSVLYASADNNLFKSENQGNSWTYYWGDTKRKNQQPKYQPTKSKKYLCYNW